MTRVWPALWPPWKRTTMSACSDNQSTILPFPSSPHWAPTTTTLAIRGYSLQFGWFEPDPQNRCPRVTAEDMLLRTNAPSPNHGRGPFACEAFHRDNGCGLSTQVRTGNPAPIEWASTH